MQTKILYRSEYRRKITVGERSEHSRWNMSCKKITVGKQVMRFGWKHELLEVIWNSIAIISNIVS